MKLIAIGLWGVMALGLVGCADAPPKVAKIVYGENCEYFQYADGSRGEDFISYQTTTTVVTTTYFNNAFIQWTEKRKARMFIYPKRNKH